ncbi:MAG: GTP cyclohydrolase I FolE2 [Euryarchaeota archaeon]|nr:GTP cyclohydrolase I FolE2 [Euryarchaeota archaeon]
MPRRGKGLSPTRRLQAVRDKGGKERLSDVQSRRPSARFKLTRVGVTGVKKPISIERPGKTVMLTATIDMYVDLPATQKGSHMSRNVEVLDEAVDRTFSKPGKSLEDLAKGLAAELLRRHDYASSAEVQVAADYFLDKKAPSGRKTTEVYRLTASAKGTRDGRSAKVKKSIGVEVVGMTACPCAMEGVREHMRGKHPEHSRALSKLPAITHNQRNVAMLRLDVPDGHDIEADTLIEIVEGALSTPTREILKRKDEAALVYAAHANPKFVEDVVRDILGHVLARYPRLPDDVGISVRSESEESIHKHSAFAERVTTIGELRA